jgi:hypothetical protein
MDKQLRRQFRLAQDPELAITEASTIWMSGGWMAKGPPATGTCHTIVTYGVGFWTVPGAHGTVPVI